MRCETHASAAVLLLAFLAVLAGGCGDAEPATGPIPIGGIFTETGPAEDTETLAGVQLALGEINHAGGVRVGDVRRPLELEILDDRADPPVAVARANELVNQRGVVALLGPVKSTLAIPVGAVAERGGVPMITSGSTNPATTRGRAYVFRTIVTDDLQGAAAASFARDRLDARKAAVVYEVSSPYSTGLASSFSAGFVREGGRVSQRVPYTSDTSDRASGVQRLAGAEPDVLYLPNTAADAAAQGRRARRLDIDATLMGGDTWAEQNFLRAPHFRGSYHTAQWSPDRKDPRSRAFVAAYRKSAREEPSLYSATAYDAVGLLAAAISKAGKAEPEAIREALDDVTVYEGVSGQLRYGRQGDPQTTIAVIRSTPRGTQIVADIDPRAIAPEPAG
ncbi:MAG: ABC transporter substrate-binding protein [Solirubrobacteraceae bacterium]|nr:ABC transporter substrate-binding protein [Solirubrobacteraceae bacterium]